MILYGLSLGAKGLEVGTTLYDLRIKSTGVKQLEGTTKLCDSVLILSERVKS